MPRNQSEANTAVRRLRQWTRENGPIGYDLAYQLILVALEADGVQPTKVLPADEVIALSAEDSAKLAAARAALAI